MRSMPPSSIRLRLVFAGRADRGWPRDSRVPLARDVAAFVAHSEAGDQGQLPDTSIDDPLHRFQYSDSLPTDYQYGGQRTERTRHDRRTERHTRKQCRYRRALRRFGAGIEILSNSGRASRRFDQENMASTSSRRVTWRRSEATGAVTTLRAPRHGFEDPGPHAGDLET